LVILEGVFVDDAKVQLSKPPFIPQGTNGRRKRKCSDYSPSGKKIGGGEVSMHNLLLLLLLLLYLLLHY